jgi:hypothetical protein
MQNPITLTNIKSDAKESTITRICKKSRDGRVARDSVGHRHLRNPGSIRIFTFAVFIR